MAKRKILTKTILVKEASRANIGPVPPTKVVPNKKDRLAHAEGKYPKRDLEEEIAL